MLWSYMLNYILCRTYFIYIFPSIFLTLYSFYIFFLFLRDEILLKKNLVEPAEHDGKDPDVIPPQNVYCSEMEQSGEMPNMLLPPNGNYIYN